MNFSTNNIPSASNPSFIKIGFIFMVLVIESLATSCSNEIGDLHGKRVIIETTRGATIDSDTNYIKVVSNRRGSTIYYVPDSSAIDSSEFTISGVLSWKREDDKIVAYSGSVRLISKGEKKYSIDGNKYLVSKLLFDEPNTMDEEAWFYANEHLGLILIKSMAWGAYSEFHLNDITTALADSILNDKTSFGYSIPEPPHPKN